MHVHATRVRAALGHAWARPLAMLGVALLTALAALVRVPIPGTPVPVTLQLLVVLAGGAALGRGWGAGAQVLYLGLGAAGLPFFAQCAGGLALFACPTAGYLAAFPAAAWLAGWLGHGKAYRGRLAAMMAGVAVVHALGALHLALVLQVPLEAAVALGVLPFVVADAAKASAAAALSGRPATPG